MNFDGYFLEYDTDRAGGFEPLRFLPKGDKIVVLGLVSSKVGTLEKKDAIKRRIDEATKFAPLEQFALSPQCGFASTEEGNILAEDEQWAKLRMIVELSRRSVGLTASRAFMPKILISYRRSDTAGVAGRIFDRLVARFGHDSIFMDVDHIPFGIDFRDHIRETLLAGDMLLAIVGPRWLGPREGARARMHDENDPVRVEIETALAERRDAHSRCWSTVRRCRRRTICRPRWKNSRILNAAPVDTGRDFHQHMDRLIRTIERILESKAGNAQAAPAATAVRRCGIHARCRSLAPPRRIRRRHANG